MINLGTIKQGTLETIAVTWELNDLTTVPASIVGATITATMTNIDTEETTAVSGTLTATGAASFTWKFSSGDSGTAGSFLVVFKAVVSGETAYTLNASLQVQANPAATAVQNDMLVGVTVDEAAWLTAGLAAVPDPTDLVDANDLGTAAYAATGDFDAAGAAAAAQAAAVQRANHTGTQTLSTISDAGTMAAQATTSYYAKPDFSASPVAAEPLKANGAGGISPTNVRIGTAATQYGYIAVSQSHTGTYNVGYHGFEDTTVINTTGTTNAYASIDCQPTVNSANSYDHLVGFQTRLTTAGSAAFTNYIHGANMRFYHNSTGTVNSYAGIRIFTPQKGVGAGTITNAYGLWIESMASVGTLNYAIYTGGGIVFHEGDIRSNSAISIADIIRVTNGITVKSPVSNAALSPALLAYNGGAGAGTGASIRLGYSTSAYAEIGGMFDGSGVAVAIKTGGAVEVARFDSSITAGNTRFMLWDVSAGALKRVSVGAANSGGTGYKLLRVVN